MTAIEVTGRIDEHQQLQLDARLPMSGPLRVRVILLYSVDDQWDETEWLQSAADSPAFDFLNDPEEDVYSLADGVPFRDEV
jgi:hypothetical protein